MKKLVPGIILLKPKQIFGSQSQDIELLSKCTLLTQTTKVLVFFNLV